MCFKCPLNTWRVCRLSEEWLFFVSVIQHCRLSITLHLLLRPDPASPLMVTMPLSSSLYDVAPCTMTHLLARLPTSQDAERMERLERVFWVRPSQFIQLPWEMLAFFLLHPPRRQGCFESVWVMMPNEIPEVREGAEQDFLWTYEAALC